MDNLFTRPTIPTEVKLRQQVQQISSAPLRLTDTILNEWGRAFNALWTTVDGITPEMKLAALGTKAGALFAENEALVQFVVSRLTGKDDALVAQIMAKVATIPPYTIHEDGTVTLN